MLFEICFSSLKRSSTLHVKPRRKKGGLAITLTTSAEVSTSQSRRLSRSEYSAPIPPVPIPTTCAALRNRPQNRSAPGLSRNGLVRRRDLKSRRGTELPDKAVRLPPE